MQPIHHATRKPHTALTALLCLVVALCVTACDSKKTEAPGDGPDRQTSPERSQEPATKGAFAISKFKVSGSQSVYRNKEAPNPEEVQKRIEAALYELDGFDPDGPRKLEGRVTYDVRPLPDGEGHDLMLIGGLSTANAAFEAGANYKSTDADWAGKSLDEMAQGAVDTFVEKIAAQARVLGSDTETIVEILKSDDEPKSARLMAIQEIRERDAKEQLDAVRPFLADDHPAELRVAAAATLVSLGDEKSRSEILKVAEDLSRDKDPQYVPMLHILADLGGREIVTYLEAVADGHPAPAVRAVAKEALDDARGGGEPSQ